MSSLLICLPNFATDYRAQRGDVASVVGGLAAGASNHLLHPDPSLATFLDPQPDKACFALRGQFKGARQITVVGSDLLPGEEWRIRGRMSNKDVAPFARELPSAISLTAMTGAVGDIQEDPLSAASPGLTPSSSPSTGVADIDFGNYSGGTGGEQEFRVVLKSTSAVVPAGPTYPVATFELYEGASFLANLGSLDIDFSQNEIRLLHLRWDGELVDTASQTRLRVSITYPSGSHTAELLAADWIPREEDLGSFVVDTDWVAVPDGGGQQAAKRMQQYYTALVSPAATLGQVSFEARRHSTTPIRVGAVVVSAGLQIGDGGFDLQSTLGISDPRRDRRIGAPRRRATLNLRRFANNKQALSLLEAAIDQNTDPFLVLATTSDTDVARAAGSIYGDFLNPETAIRLTQQPGRVAPKLEIEELI